jgi:uncharacterized protein YyaL (SSP411 family)
MKKVSIVIIVLVVIVAGVLYFSSSSNTPQAKDNSMAVAPTPSPEAAPAPEANVTKFADQAYYKFSYEIDPKKLGNLDATTKKALSGFKVTAKNNADGTVTVSLTSTNKEYHNQSYTLKTGEKLYFIEKSLGDDNNDTEAFLGDDTAVVVDSNGNVVSQ